jgi:hypothetical protein
VLGSVVAWGLAIVVVGVAFGFAPLAPAAMLTLAVVGLIVGGAADMASAAFRQSILLAAADDSVRGRLQGVFIVVVVGGPRLADVLHGAASEWAGPAWTTAGGGLLVVLFTLVVAGLSPRFRSFRL